MSTASCTDEKLNALHALLDSYGCVAIGYSGGVDSTFLAAVCARWMPERSMLIHLTTPLIGTPEQASFEAAGCGFGIPVLELNVDPLSNPDVAANPADRCYHCKRAGFGAILRCAAERGCDTVVDGSNADDANDFRPGMRACEELGVRSPLLETGWHKDEERELLRAWGYDVWNMPAGACLATRIPCGEPLTAGKLVLVRACEDYLHELGLAQVRVRLVAGRVQLQAAPADLVRLAALAGDAAPATDGSVAIPASVLAVFRELGATDIDPVATPYAHGSMNG